MSFASHYDEKANLSRRSVDWRDSGIVIDEDQLHFGTPFDSTVSETTAQATTSTGFNFNIQSTSSSSSPSSSSPSFPHPLQQQATGGHQLRSLQEIATGHDDDGDTILHLAVVGFSSAQTKDLIKISDLNAINNMMQTPLHVAVLANRSEMVELLLKSGFDSYAHDRRGNTPLHLACQMGLNEIVEILLTHSKTTSDKQSMTIEQYLLVNNFDGQTSLHLAAINDRRSTIELLVNKFTANINSRDSKSGETILHKAIKNFNVELVEFILSLNKHCNETDFSARRPADTVRILKESRLNPDQFEKTLKIEQLIACRLDTCRKQEGGCCTILSKEENSNNEILDSDSNSSSFSSDYSGSDCD